MNLRIVMSKPIGLAQTRFSISDIGGVIKVETPTTRREPPNVYLLTKKPCISFNIFILFTHRSNSLGNKRRILLEQDQECFVRRLHDP